jgi:hypothetical protein
VVWSCSNGARSKGGRCSSHTVSYAGAVAEESMLNVSMLDVETFEVGWIE